MNVGIAPLSQNRVIVMASMSGLGQKQPVSIISGDRLLSAKSGHLLAKANPHRTVFVGATLALFPVLSCDLRGCNEMRIVLGFPPGQTVVEFEPRQLTLDA